MAASEKVLALLLRLRTDPAAQRKTESDLEALRDLLDKTSKSTISIDEAGAKVNARLAELARAKAVDNIAEDAIQAARDADSWADALARVAQNLSEIGASEAEINRVADALAKAQQQGSGIGAGAGGGLSGVERLGSSAGQILSGLGASEAANSVGLITDAVGAIGAFGPVAGAATLAGGALVAITSQIGAAWEAAKKQAEDYLARQDALSQLTASGATTEDYQRQIAETQAQQQDLARRTSAVQDYKNQIDSVRDTIANLIVDLTDPAIDFDPNNPNRRQQTQALLDQARAAEQQLVAGISGAFNGELDSYETLTQALEGGRTKLDEFSTQITALQAELYTSGVAANDAAAAIAAIEAARDKQVSTELAAAQEAEQLTAEQRRQRVEALQAELDAINVAAQREGISAEYKAELAARTEELSTRIRVLSSDIYTAADAAAAAAARTEALKKQTEQLLDALEREGDARADLRKAEQAVQSAREKQAADALKLAQDAEEKRTDIVAESGDRRAELERKSQEEIRKVERDYARTKYKAIGDRDALEARLAQIARADKLDDQRRSDDEAAAQLEATQGKQLESLRKSLEKQSATLEASYGQQQQALERTLLQEQLDLLNATNATNAIRDQEIAGRLIKEEAANVEKLSQQKLFNERVVKTTKDGLTQRLNDLAAATRSEAQIKRTGQMQSLNDLASTEAMKANLHKVAQNQELLRVSSGYAQMYTLTDQYMTAIVNRFLSGLQQMANGFPAGGGAYNLYGVTTQPLTTQTVTRTVDYRLSQYFQSAGITER